MFRTLTRDVHIHCPDRHTADQLAFIGCDAEIAGQRERVDMRVETHHGFLRLSKPGGVCVEGSAGVVLDELYRLRFEMVRAECRGGGLLVAAGTVTAAVGHIVFVGGEPVVMSALLIHLAAQGWPVTGDALLIVEGSAARPFPGSLRVGLSALGRLPEHTAEIVRTSPRIPGWFDQPTFAVQPSAFGNPCRIRAAPMRHVVVLEDNHGGRSRMQRLARSLAVEEMFQNLLLPAEGRARSLAEFMGLMAHADCWHLTVGLLDDAGRLLQGLPDIDQDDAFSGVRHVER